MLALNPSPSWSSFEIALPESAPVEADADFEDELLALLCRLEYLRETMFAARAERRWLTLLTLAGEFMDLVVAFCKRTCPFSTAKELNEATRRASEFAADAAALRTAAADSGGKDPSAPMDAAVARPCFAAFHDAVFNYFVVLTNRFPTSLAARSWVDVAATFVVELKHLTQDPVPAA